MEMITRTYPLRTRTQFVLAPCVFLLTACLFCRPAAALSGFTLTPENTLENYNINDLVGANTFYNAGYTGTDAIVANVEAGLIWNGQQSLTQVTTQIPNPYIPNGVGEYDMHATWVGSALAGQGTDTGNNGIAPGATVWSGAMATSWTDPGSATYTGSFNVSIASLMTPYIAAMDTGVNGQTANVITSSWGTNDAGTQGGASGLVLALDSLVARSGATMVFAAGNSGPNPNTIFEPASGNNFIIVGATTDLATGPYTAVAPYSSQSPSDFYDPTIPSGAFGVTNEFARAVVDLVAPGNDLELAHYGGATGGNAFGGVTDSDTDTYNYFLDGTSFATPIVAGGAALVVDAGKQLFPNDPNAVDGRVVKAVLMNSATQLPGYNNGQNLLNGVITTTQSLDYSQGAGQLNLTGAFAQYTAGTTDVPTPIQGTPAVVQKMGWAFGNIAQLSGATATRDYLINTKLPAGATLTATVDWFSDDQYDDTQPTALNVDYGSFDDLNLLVYETTGSAPTKLVAQTDGLFLTVDHLSFQLPDDATYMLEVDEFGYLYNFDDSTNTNYAIAWSVALPEPATGSLLLLGTSAILMRRRRPRTNG
jgi:hypothetical protein